MQDMVTIDFLTTKNISLEKELTQANAAVEKLRQENESLHRVLKLSHRTNRTVNDAVMNMKQKNEMLRQENGRYRKALPLDEWHEDMGPCLWWKFPIEEEPYCGSPLDMDFPDCVTHFTEILLPEGGAIHDNDI